MKKLLAVLLLICLFISAVTARAESGGLGEWTFMNERKDIIGAYLKGGYDAPGNTGIPAVVLFMSTDPEDPEKHDFYCSVYCLTGGEQPVRIVNEEGRQLLFETAILDPLGKQHVITGTMELGSEYIRLGSGNEKEVLPAILNMDGTVKFSLTRVDDPGYHCAFAIPDTATYRSVLRSR